MTWRQVARDLEVARGLIAERGLAKGTMQAADGSLCSNGAVVRAATGCAWTLHQKYNGWFSMAPVRLRERIGWVHEALTYAISDYGDVLYWNNAPERTKDEVIAAFDAAISLALSEDALSGGTE